MSGEEEDKKDETWCLYDGELIDDELFNELARFAEGVRVLVLSDDLQKQIAAEAARVRNVDPDAALAQLHAGATDRLTSLAAKMNAAVLLIDLALLPIGAYEPRWFMRAVHMNPAEAVQAHLDLGGPESLGMHFGTFQLTTEDIDEPLHALDAARRERGVPPSRFRTIAFGDSVRVGV